MCTSGAANAAPESKANTCNNRNHRATVIAKYAKAGVTAFVALQLGLAAVRFVRRKLGAKHNPRTPSSSPQGQSFGQDRTNAAQQANLPSEDAWTLVDAPAPSTPEGYKPMVNTVLPCSPQQLYNILFSSSGTELYVRQHKEVGKHWDVALTGWRRAPAAGGAGAEGADGSLLGPTSVFEYVVGQPGSGGYTRLLTFWNPKKPPNTADTRCVQRQQLCVYRGGELLFATAMNMLDIPFRDCFTVNTFWRVAPGTSPGSCSVSIHLKVNFLKRAFGVGGIISATTSSETSAFFNAFIANVERYIRTQQQEQQQAPPPRSRLQLTPSSSPSPASASAAAAAGVPKDVGVLGGGGGGGGGAAAPLRETLPAWKQIRALLVFALLCYMLLTQLHQGQQLAALRARTASLYGDSGVDDAAATTTTVASAVYGGSVAAAATQLLAAAVGRVAAATVGLHGLLLELGERVGGHTAGRAVQEAATAAAAAAAAEAV
ncbi:hypothetical protein Agub_g12420 [Astrephomene gubernaculifera]|uniref:VASt domain-containing protein n=1 Tax=Astrephomene gubernaculifera TaxID=47775 RepID=A0AAD3E2N6_9CHLO|nr:hypothetical protein Agub_g12420 [Astrephomene gubernaculifera]